MHIKNSFGGVRDKKEAPNLILPDRWECTALLHPYSPPPTIDHQATPFFQLCIASISYVKEQVLSIKVKGVEYGAWWYRITPQKTELSLDQGITWEVVDMGWTLPTTQWLGPASCFFTTSHLNWMQTQEVDWWKMSVPNSPATTWMWFDHETGHPFRMMFGSPPPSPNRGSPEQLAFFQNFSFTYFSSFEAVDYPNVNSWIPPLIPGFQSGNPDDRQLPVWDNCFSMKTLMTPVDSKSFPLPTTVFYQWKPDDAYQDTTDRSQSTIMSYQYNPGASYQTEVALLYGVAPLGINPPPRAGSGYIYNETDFWVKGQLTQRISCRNIGLGQQPPHWARIPSIKGLIHASIKDHKTLCRGHNVNLISALFPPTPLYPQGRYLWTWYSPYLGSDGTWSKPVWFGESASNLKEGGTCLALADYFEYRLSQAWFPADIFELPSVCSVKTLPFFTKGRGSLGWFATEARQNANFKMQLVNAFSLILGCLG